MKVFIGSSTEGKEYVEILKGIMHDERAGLEPVPWSEIFRPGDIIIERLIKAANDVDAAVLIWTPDDEAYFRNSKVCLPRDNLVFEAGLFIHALTNERTKILVGGNDVKTLSDLGGVVMGYFSDKIMFKEEARKVCGELSSLGPRRPYQPSSLSQNGALPAVQFAPNGRVLAIGSHWDDILLGCLGTLRKLQTDYNYKIDVLVVCDNYLGRYFSAHQPNLDTKVREIYNIVCEAFNFLEYPCGDAKRQSFVDRQISAKYDRLPTYFEEYQRYSKKISSSRHPLNLILCPPVDDMHEDHAIVGREVFKYFRQSSHTVLEYPIKRYTDRSFVPNVCVVLEDRVCGDIINVISSSRITQDIVNSKRYFSNDVIMARRRMAHLDYAKDTEGKYAEVFRGRMEVGGRL